MVEETTRNPGTAAGSALLVVDVQADFLPGGALAVEAGDDILGPITELMRSDEAGVCVATQDWHPTDHVSFVSQHEGHDPMDVVEIHGNEQILWPVHCVAGSPGAELHEDLPWDRVAAIIRKGMDRDSDSYSGFRNNWNADGERPPTGLAGYLEARGVTDVYVCGLARDVCCKWTAEDAVEAGFHTHFLWSLTRAVDPSTDDAVRSDLRARGVRMID